MIEIRALGPLDLRTAEGTALQSVMAQPKRAALLVYLCLAARSAQPRDTLLGLFWPELEQERARKALNQSVYVLRRALGAESVVTREGQVGVDAGRVWCDAVAFEARLDEGEAERALALYGGDLLEGLFLEDAPEFERWHELERARLRQRAVEAALTLARDRLEAGAAPSTIELLRRVMGWSPYDERAATALVRALDAAGDRAGAIREARAFSERLSRDLDIEAGPLLEGLEEASRPARSVPPGPATRLAAGVEPAPAPEHDGDRPESSGLSPAARPPEPARGTPSRRTSLAAVTAIAAMLASAVLFVLSPSDTRPSPESRRVVILPFEGSLAEGEFDPLGRIAADRVAHGLLETGLVEVVAPGTAPDLGELRAADSPTRLARATGAGLLVRGLAIRDGDSVRVSAQLVSLPEGRLLRTLAPVSAPGDAPLEAIETIRHRIAGTTATVLDPRLRNWAAPASPPPSYRAYALLVEGLEHYLRLSDDHRREAARLFLRAGEEDPDFTLPLLWAVRVHRQLGERDVADSLRALLSARRERLSPWDRAMLDHEEATAAGDTEGAYRALQVVNRLTPGSEWQFELAAVAFRLNRLHETVRLLETLDPRQGWLADWPYHGYYLTNARHRLGDHEAELADARRWVALHPDFGNARMAEVIALIGAGRLEEALRRAEDFLAAEGPTEAARLALNNWGVELQAHGYEAEGRAFFRRVVELMDGTDRSTGDAQRMYGLALLRSGDSDRARPVLESALGAWPADHPYRLNIIGFLGLAAAQQRDTAEVARIFAALDARPEAADRASTLFWRARIHAQRGELDEARRYLRRAFPNGEGHGYLHWAPELRPLHDDPVYQDIVRPKG